MIGAAGVVLGERAPELTVNQDGDALLEFLLGEPVTEGDNLLGEDDVERWIGTIDVLTEPIQGRTPDELRSEVARRAVESSGESWVLAERSDGAIVVANADRDLDGLARRRGLYRSRRPHAGGVVEGLAAHGLAAA